MLDLYPVISLSGTPFCELQEESQLAKITRDSAKITVEQVHGLMSQVSQSSDNLVLKFIGIVNFCFVFFTHFFSLRLSRTFFSTLCASLTDLALSHLAQNP